MEWTDWNCRLGAIFISLGPVYEYVCNYALHLGQIILGQVRYGGQDSNAARIRDETSEILQCFVYLWSFKAVV